MVKPVSQAEHVEFLIEYRPPFYPLESHYIEGGGWHFFSMAGIDPIDELKFVRKRNPEYDFRLIKRTVWTTVHEDVVDEDA